MSNREDDLLLLLSKARVAVMSSAYRNGGDDAELLRQMNNALQDFDVQRERAAEYRTFYMNGNNMFATIVLIRSTEGIGFVEAKRVFDSLGLG